MRVNESMSYDIIILEILRTRNITPPSYKLFNLEVDAWCIGFFGGKNNINT